ncbi:protein cornichon homolog 1 isoform X1 [Actinidia eriantha]|uniref:protein cornichon homolog 1 isoform X1 n=1 Tax=Actinidia eriantha TaxID=165200 RepID=UPI00258C6CB1|nr:protein cornichon homolog 1 isoform X1 [Actinidia eriantha]
MAWEAIFWLIFFLMNMALIAFNLYQIVCLSDLEADYMNPYESSSRINAVIVPEFVTHGVFCALFLLAGHWIMFLVTLPIAFYNAMLYMKRQHLIDVTEVFRFLNAEKKYRIIKLAFYLVLFAVVIIRIFSAGTFFNILSVFHFNNEELDIRSSFLEF